MRGYILLITITNQQPKLLYNKSFTELHIKMHEVVYAIRKDVYKDFLWGNVNVKKLEIRNILQSFF